MRSPISTRRPWRGPMRGEELLNIFYVEKNFVGSPIAKRPFMERRPWGGLPLIVVFIRVFFRKEAFLRSSTMKIPCIDLLWRKDLAMSLAQKMNLLLLQIYILWTRLPCYLEEKNIVKETVLWKECVLKVNELQREFLQMRSRGNNMDMISEFSWIRSRGSLLGPEWGLNEWLTEGASIYELWAEF